MKQSWTGQFTPTADDAAKCTRALWTWHVFRPVTMLGILAFFGILAALLAFTSFIPLWVILTAVGLAIPITLALVLLVLAPINGRRLFRQTAHLKEVVSVEWDLDGIAFHQQRGNSRYDWGDFYRWGLSTSHLFLFLGEAISLMVPRQALGEGELAALEGLRGAGVRQY